MDEDFFSASSSRLSIGRNYTLTSVKWNVTSLPYRRSKCGEVIRSPIFNCSNASWQLYLKHSVELQDDYDDGMRSVKTDLSRVSTTSGSSEPNFSMSYKIDVFDTRKRKLHSFVSKKRCCGCKIESKATSFEIHDRDLYWIKNCLLISCMMKIEQDDVSPVAPLGDSTGSCTDARKEPAVLDCSLTSLSANFEELQNNPKFSDVTLKVGEEVFQGHKSVLSARSKVFAAMFDHDLKESREHTVDLVHMEAETVRDMLRYIYCGKVREFSPEEALNLYVAADRYELQELTTVCREVILNNICINNVCDIALVAELHDDESLISAMKFFIAEHGKEVIQTEKWKTMKSTNSLLCAKMFEWAFSE